MQTYANADYFRCGRTTFVKDLRLSDVDIYPDFSSYKADTLLVQCIKLLSCATITLTPPITCLACIFCKHESVFSRSRQAWTFGRLLRRWDHDRSRHGHEEAEATSSLRSTPPIGLILRTHGEETE
jgi:hypothetical protein